MNMYPCLVIVVGIVVLVVRVERGAGDQAGQGEQQQQHGYMVGESSLLLLLRWMRRGSEIGDGLHFLHSFLTS